MSEQLLEVHGCQLFGVLPVVTIVFALPLYCIRIHSLLWGCAILILGAFS